MNNVLTFEAHIYSSHARRQIGNIKWNTVEVFVWSDYGQHRDSVTPAKNIEIEYSRLPRVNILK